MYSREVLAPRKGLVLSNFSKSSARTRRQIWQCHQPKGDGFVPCSSSTRAKVHQEGTMTLAY